MTSAPFAPSAVVAGPTLPAVAASDPGSSRLVYAAVGGLVLIGVAFVVLAVWLIRQTRVDPVVLAPLERMGDGDWRRKDPATQRRLLDEVRPEGAEPLDPVPAPPGVDDEFERSDRSVRSLDDLEPLQPEGVGTPSGGTPAPDLTTTDPDAEPLDETSADETDDAATHDRSDGAADDDRSEVATTDDGDRSDEAADGDADPGANGDEESPEDQTVADAEHR